ncbi:MAG TPA: hypothetical protein VNJ08_01975 [Bacteriovoracaceae bacterium]|nr:hypothetical protein [Bacteriovoracaceae bacterium]
MKTFEDFYVKKDYSNALKFLQKHAGELPPGLLHYNLGTVYSQMENWALARYHFLQAHESGFSLPALTINQEAVEKRLEIDRLENPQSASDYLIKASLFAKEGIFTSMSLIFLVLGLLILKKNPNFKKVMLWTLLVVSPVGLNYWVDSWPRLVVTEPQALSEGPSAIFNTNGELPAGVMIIVRGKGDWQEVIYPSRFTGWVKTSALKKLE